MGVDVLFGFADCVLLGCTFAGGVLGGYVWGLFVIAWVLLFTIDFVICLQVQRFGSREVLVGLVLQVVCVGLVFTGCLRLVGFCNIVFVLL